jgi:hypothetical protein
MSGYAGGEHRIIRENRFAAPLSRTVRFDASGDGGRDHGGDRIFMACEQPAGAERWQIAPRLAGSSRSGGRLQGMAAQGAARVAGF